MSSAQFSLWSSTSPTSVFQKQVHNAVQSNPATAAFGPYVPPNRRTTPDFKGDLKRNNDDYTTSLKRSTGYSSDDSDLSDCGSRDDPIEFDGQSQMLTVPYSTSHKKEERKLNENWRRPEGQPIAAPAGISHRLRAPTMNARGEEFQRLVDHLTVLYPKPANKSDSQPSLVPQWIGRTMPSKSLPSSPRKKHDRRVSPGYTLEDLAQLISNVQRQKRVHRVACLKINATRRRESDVVADVVSDVSDGHLPFVIPESARAMDQGQEFFKNITRKVYDINGADRNDRIVESIGFVVQHNHCFSAFKQLNLDVLETINKQMSDQYKHCSNSQVGITFSNAAKSATYERARNSIFCTGQLTMQPNMTISQIILEFYRNDQNLMKKEHDLRRTEVLLASTKNELEYYTKTYQAHGSAHREMNNVLSATRESLFTFKSSVTEMQMKLDGLRDEFLRCIVLRAVNEAKDLRFVIKNQELYCDELLKNLEKVDYRVSEPLNAQVQAIGISGLDVQRLHHDNLKELKDNLTLAINHLDNQVSLWYSARDIFDWNCVEHSQMDFLISGF